MTELQLMDVLEKAYRKLVGVDFANLAVDQCKEIVEGFHEDIDVRWLAVVVFCKR